MWQNCMSDAPLAPSSNGCAIVRIPPPWSSLRGMKMLKSLIFFSSALFCQELITPFSSWILCSTPRVLWAWPGSAFQLNFTSLDKGTVLLWWGQSQLKLTWCFKKQNSSSQRGCLIASMFYVMNNISHLQSKISRQMASFLPSWGRGRTYDDVVSVKTDVLFKCCKLNKE